MARTRQLGVMPDQDLIKRYKQFTGIDRDLIFRELRRRFDSGSLTCMLPRDLLSAFKKSARAT